MGLLTEQVDDCLNKGTATLASLIEPDGVGGLRSSGDLEVSQPLEKLLTGILQCIEGQEQAIRIIVAAVDAA